MRTNDAYHVARGMVLPLVLLFVAVVMLAVVAVSSVSTVERRATRLRVEQVQAKLAVSVAFGEVGRMLMDEAANDRFVVLEASPKLGNSSQHRDPAYLFLANPEWVGGAYRYRYIPLFSSAQDYPPTAVLQAPERGGAGESSDPLARLRTQPWLEPAEVDWLPVTNAEGEVVARYSYWLEDLQGLLDPMVAGNMRGVGGRHVRKAFPFPVAGVSNQAPTSGDPAMDQVAVYALDEDAIGRQQGAMAARLLGNRRLLVSPRAALAAAGVTPPLERMTVATGGRYSGQLIDLTESRVEESLITGLRPYFEQALVPYVDGVSPEVVGKSKLNLNRLLADERGAAVNEMARWIERALPQFGLRRGGFPDDYLKVLAANALDYADADQAPTLLVDGSAGIDGQPFLSEVVLHLHFQKLQQLDGRWVLRWRFRLFAELWNLTSQPIDGVARLSYEVNLRSSAMGVVGVGRPFDDPSILDDPNQSQHQLEKIDGRYYGPPVAVALLPDEYRFYEFATVDYTIDHEPQFDAAGQPVAVGFALVEQEDEARGVELVWNDQVVGRVDRMVRDAYGLSSFRTDHTRKTAKACIPGLNYGALGMTENNMGDPRIAPYLRATPLGENAYPENVSPHRRNIRRRNIYDKDPDPRKTRHYGRVQPSQWPDGGHDSATGDFYVTTSDAAVPTDESKWPIDQVPTPQAGNAPQRISNAGRFYSATEWGRVFDPVMWRPVYPDLPGETGSGAQDTRVLTGHGIVRPVMPVRRMAWPEVSRASVPSVDHGGGNTLRVGRPEHERFDQAGLRAALLLDLFHAGISTSDAADEREGPVVRVFCQVNVNTAGRDVLRCMAAGMLGQDPLLARVTDWNHDTQYALGPQIEPLDLDAPGGDDLASRVADAILLSRPFASRSEMAHATDEDGVQVFGNREMYEESGNILWSDAAAEEVFGRVYEASTVRSRHFRVWVVGQSLGGTASAPEVLAQYRRVFTVFVDPGERAGDGSLVPEHQRIHVLYESAF